MLRAKAAMCPCASHSHTLFVVVCASAVLQQLKRLLPKGQCDYAIAFQRISQRGYFAFACTYATTDTHIDLRAHMVRETRSPITILPTLSVSDGVSTIENDRDGEHSTAHRERQRQREIERDREAIKTTRTAYYDRDQMDCSKPAN